MSLRGRRPAFPSVAAASTSMASSESEERKETKLWGGRFEEGVTDAVEGFTESISYDWQLYKYDIMGSKAHASMLAAQVLCARASTVPICFVVSVGGGGSAIHLGVRLIMPALESCG